MSYVVYLWDNICSSFSLRMASDVVPRSLNILILSCFDPPWSQIFTFLLDFSSKKKKKKESYPKLLYVIQMR